MITNEVKTTRPGGALSRRMMYFITLMDTSLSMIGDKINAVNAAGKALIPLMKKQSELHPVADVEFKAISFNDSAECVSSGNISEAAWTDMEASGLTNFGEALQLLIDLFSNMQGRYLPSIIVLLSDGNPTDFYEDKLEQLWDIPAFKKAVKVAIEVKGANRRVLEEFTGDSNMIFSADKAGDIVELIRWSSTLIGDATGNSSEYDMTDYISDYIDDAPVQDEFELLENDINTDIPSIDADIDDEIW